MSRKRFIKLLMAEGISRNQAVQMAMRARIEGIPYKRAASPIRIGYRERTAIMMIAKAFLKTGFAAEECARQIRLLCEEAK